MKCIKQIYVDNSGGSRNLFFRPKGLIVFTGHFAWFKQDKDEYIVQFNGTPDRCSGYHKQSFDSEEAAFKHFNDSMYSTLFTDLESTI